MCGMCRVDMVIFFSLRSGGRTKWQEGHRLDTEIEMVRDAEKPERGIQVPKGADDALLMHSDLWCLLQEPRCWRKQ